MVLQDLPLDLVKKAKLEINEEPSRREDDIECIKQWASKQPHLKLRADADWILAFLRGCKFSLEKTKEKLDFFYTIRNMLPEFFSNRDPFLPEIQEILKLGLILPLVKANSLEETIIVIRMGAYDPRQVKTEDFYKTLMMLMDVGLMKDHSGLINGTRVVQDWRGLGLEHLQGPTVHRRALVAIQSGYPNRSKGLHLLHPPPYFETFYSTMRPFLTDKSKQRVMLHATVEDMAKVIPQHRLPREYGGEAGSIAELAETFRLQLESYREWFQDDAKFGVEESRRPALHQRSSETVADLLGLQGSFRQLNVD